MQVLRALGGADVLTGGPGGKQEAVDQVQVLRALGPRRRPPYRRTRRPGRARSPGGRFTGSGRRQSLSRVKLELNSSYTGAEVCRCQD